MLKNLANINRVLLKSFFVLIVAGNTNVVHAQVNITRIEYYMDSDPGIGNATSLSITPSPDLANLSIPVNPSALSSGIHRLSVRAKDANGKWSLTNSWLFYKPYSPAADLPALSNINYVEYYLDIDPGIGNGKQLNITPGTDLSDQIISVNPETLSPCSHILYVRARDANGKWSLVNSYSFLNENTTITAPPQDMMVSLDGVNAYIDLGTWFNVPNFTVSFWVNPDSIQANGAAIAALQNDLYLYANPNTKDNYILAHLLQFDLLPNKWNHITITVDKATNIRKVYLFGQLIDSNTWTYSPLSGFNLRFGNGGFFPSSYFKGQIDEVKLWNHVISPDSIIQNVSKKLTGNEPGLLGYWDFNNGCATAANDLTSGGHFANLINGALKVPSTVPNIGQNIIPNKAGNTNIVTVKIYDNLFKQGAVAKLTKEGFADIIADTTIVSNDGSIATLTFDLTGKDTGLYNINVINPDTTLKTYINSFTIEKGTAPDLWVDIIGRNVMRNGRAFTFLVAYGNNGNVDAKGVPLWVILKNDTTTNLKLNFDIAKPKDFENAITYDSIPLYYNTDSLWGNPGLAQVVPLYMPIIPAGSTGYLSFTITANAGIEIEVILDKPFFQSPLSENVAKCVSDLIFKRWDKFVKDDLKKDLEDLIPIYGCLKSAYETINLYKKYINHTDDAPSKGSMMWNMAATIGACGSDAFPAIKLFRMAKKMLDWYKDFRTTEACINAFKGEAKVTEKVEVVGSYDPNEKVGPTKYQQTKSPFNYSILFENKQSATAPAQTVTIIDTLDKSKFDISTFSFGPFGFGDTLGKSTYQFHKSYSTNIDLRPAKNLIAKVEGRVDTTEGIAYWKFYSLDPATMLLTDEPLDGFLPPNKTSPEGEGWVTFNIKPYPWLESGTPITNKATIIFDNNAPIITNLHENIIDKTPPISNVKPLRSSQPDSNFVLMWTGRDSIISGIKSWDIYVSDNLSAYQLWKRNTPDSFDVYEGHPGHEYRFYSIAKDNADNVENSKTLFEAITRVTLTIGDSICVGDNGKIIADVYIPGNTYRWQVNAGAGFSDVVNGGVYSNANRDTLSIATPPSSFAGYKYRCIITSGGISDTSAVHELYFTNLWTGAVNDTWENAANWDCNLLPDANTDVILRSDASHFPSVSTNVSCRSIVAASGTSVNVKPGVKITLTGNKHN